jgi:hypothetical protein
MKSITSFEEPQTAVSAYYKQQIFLDTNTKNKIQRHLTDINDVITEEDIRNIDTSLTIRNSQGSALVTGFHAGSKK